MASPIPGCLYEWDKRLLWNIAPQEERKDEHFSPNDDIAAPLFSARSYSLLFSATHEKKIHYPILWSKVDYD